VKAQLLFVSLVNADLILYTVHVCGDRVRFHYIESKIEFRIYKGKNNDCRLPKLRRLEFQRVPIRTADEGCIAGAFQIIQSRVVGRRVLDRCTREKLDQPEILAFKGVLFSKESIRRTWQSLYINQERKTTRRREEKRKEANGKQRGIKVSKLL